MSTKKAYIDDCQIDSVGAKWLCKANLSRLTWIGLQYNFLGEEGGIIMSKANMPNLNDIDLSTFIRI